MDNSVSNIFVPSCSKALVRLWRVSIVNAYKLLTDGQRSVHACGQLSTNALCFGFTQLLKSILRPSCVNFFVWIFFFHVSRSEWFHRDLCPNLNPTVRSNVALKNKKKNNLVLSSYRSRIVCVFNVFWTPCCVSVQWFCGAGEQTSGKYALALIRRCGLFETSRRMLNSRKKSFKVLSSAKLTRTLRRMTRTNVANASRAALGAVAETTPWYSQCS